MAISTLLQNLQEATVKKYSEKFGCPSQESKEQRRWGGLFKYWGGTP